VLGAEFTGGGVGVVPGVGDGVTGGGVGAVVGGGVGFVPPSQVPPDCQRLGAETGFQLSTNAVWSISAV
jgi:hypothetical protein